MEPVKLTAPDYFSHFRGLRLPHHFDLMPPTHRKDNSTGKKRCVDDLGPEDEDERDSAPSVETRRKRVRWDQDGEAAEGEETQDESESEDSSPEKVCRITSVDAFSLSAHCNRFVWRSTVRRKFRLLV